MSTPPERLDYLLAGYADKQYTDAEREELLALLQDDWNRIELGQTVPGVDWNKMYQEIMGIPTLQPRVKRNVIKINWYRWAAAASIILMLGLGAYLVFFNKSPQQNDVVKTELPKDVKAPTTNRAMITLANGQQVYLDSVGNGTLAMQGSINVVKLADGKIVYSVESEVGSQEIKYNTLSNPRGSKVIDMTLADGSRVWLNAGSSLTYPVEFIGSERKVSITGEAYFEIAHNASMPFKVSKAEMEVTVLGTHFNVNAYEDESEIKVTLLEGSVRVSAINPSTGSGQKSKVIKPGEQAQVNQQGLIAVNESADIEQVMAWKNGYFSFGNADLHTVMRQIARWYDVDVVYEGEIPERSFGGEISRNNNLSRVLKVLQESDVNFRMEGKKIVVIP